MGDAFDQAYAHEGDAFDRAYKPAADPFEAAYAAPGLSGGQAAGAALAKLEASPYPPNVFDGSTAEKVFDAETAKAGIDVNATPSFWTPEDRSNLNTYGPMALATVASLAAPVTSPLATGLLGVGLNSAARGATSLLEGEGAGAALHAANPIEHKLDTAAALTLPFVIRAVANGLGAGPVSELSDFRRATSLDAPLREFPGAPVRAEGTFEPIERQPWHTPADSSPFPRESGFEGPAPQPWQAPAESTPWPATEPWHGPHAPFEPWPQRVPFADQLGIEAPPTAPPAEPPFELNLPLGAPQRVPAPLTEEAIPGNPELNRWQTTRAALSASSEVLGKSDDPMAQAAYQRTLGLEMERDRLASQAHAIADQITAHLTPAELDQVTLVRSGAVAPNLVKPHIAEAADALGAMIYQPLGRQAINAGMVTRTADGNLDPFRMISANYSPEIPVPDEAKPFFSFRTGTTGPSQVAYQRTGNDIPLLTNARDIAHAYIDTMARKIATTNAFGAPDQLGGWGRDAQAIYDALSNPLHKVMFAQDMNRIYANPAVTSGEQLARKLAGMTGKVVLGQSGLTQIPQLSTNLMRAGVGNTIEGLTRYATDPSFRELVQSSGALTPGLANNAAETGVNMRAVGPRFLKTVENTLRGVGNAGAIPQAEKLGAAMQAAADAGAAPSASVLRQATELGLPTEGAPLTAEDLRNAFQMSSHQNQFHSQGVGNIGDTFQSPYAKLAFQFGGYGQSAFRNFLNSLARPAASGVANLAPSELGLAGVRAARWLPAAVGLAAAKNAVVSELRGQDFDPGRAITDAAETLVGTPARAVTYPLARLGIIPEEHYDPANAVIPPAAGLAVDAVKHPGLATLDVAAALDPTGVLAFLRPSARALYFQSQRGD